MQHHGCHCSMFLLKEGALLSLREFPHSKASTSWFVLKMTLPGETSCKKSSHSAVAAASHKQDTQLRSAKKKSEKCPPVFTHDSTYTTITLQQPCCFLHRCNTTPSGEHNPTPNGQPAPSAISQPR